MWQVALPARAVAASVASRTDLSVNLSRVVFAMLKNVLANTLLFIRLPLCIAAAWACGPAHAGVVASSDVDIKIRLVGFAVLEEKPIFSGDIKAQSSIEMDTLYHGLALLVFEGGQTYPAIIGDGPVSLHISDPGSLPVFTPGSENEFFYRKLSGESTGAGQFDFALLMIEAKQLLDSSSAIRKSLQKRRKCSRSLCKSITKSSKTRICSGASWRSIS